MTDMLFFTAISGLMMTSLFFMSQLPTGMADDADEYMVKNPTMPECSHLAITIGQMNWFVGDQGQRCCMCTIGTYMADQCKIGDPNSTRCDSCEYDAGKQTYIHYGPHMLDSCYKDTTSCMLPMIKVGGSPSSSSRCECPPGSHRVNRHLCEPDSHSSEQTTVDQRNRAEIVTPSSSSNVYHLDHSNPSFNGNFATTALLETRQNPTVLTTPANLSGTEILNSSNALASTDSGLNYTSVSTSPTKIQHNLAMLYLSYFIQILAASAGIVPLAVGVCWIARRLRCLTGVLSFCKRNRDGSLSSVAPAPISEKLDLQDDEIIQITTASGEEMPQTHNDAVYHVANELGEDKVRLILPRNVQSSVQNRSQRGHEKSVASENLALFDPPVRKHTPEDCDKGKSVIAARLSELEINLRLEAFMKWAEVIDEVDLFSVGRQLLSKIPKGFDDAYGKDITCGRAEKARKVFLRAMKVNPQLQLEEMKELVPELGYLREIVEEKIEILKTDGDVD